MDFHDSTNETIQALISSHVHLLLPLPGTPSAALQRWCWWVGLRHSACSKLIDLNTSLAPTTTCNSNYNISHSYSTDFAAQCVSASSVTVLKATSKCITAQSKCPCFQLRCTVVWDVKLNLNFSFSFTLFQKFKSYSRSQKFSNYSFGGFFP